MRYDACQQYSGKLPAVAGACVCVLAAGAAVPAAAVPMLAPVDFSACANAVGNIGQPVGVSTGNSGKAFAKLGFTLLDPASGNNIWVGGASNTLTIKLSVAAPTRVYVLMNTYYGQSGIANGSVVFKGTNSTHKGFSLIGDKTIRDYNNWVWTNSINGTSVQEWWTNNLNPSPDDQSHRIDAHLLNLGVTFSGQTLTQIQFRAPATAGVNYMEPVLFAIGVDAGGSSAPIPATCVAK